MVLKANFNILKQCPQVYIYILAIITSALVTLKLSSKQNFVCTLISGALSTVILMGINYCDWYFQFITWFFSFMFLLIAFVNIKIFFFMTPKQIEELKKLQ